MHDQRVINQRFERAFRVRRRHVQIWLNFLRENHPDYRDVHVDPLHLAALPEDGSIHRQLPTRLVDEQESTSEHVQNPPPSPPLPPSPSPAAAPISFTARERPCTGVAEQSLIDLTAATFGLTATGFPPPTAATPTGLPAPTAATVTGLSALTDTFRTTATAFEPDESLDNLIDTTAMVPDLRPITTELEQLQQALAPANHLLSVPTFRQTPISEFDKRPLLRMVFPSLFPLGKGDINLLRGQQLSFDAWARHLLRYKYGRFARHSRLRYVLFNMSMHQQAQSQATWLCSRLDTDISLQNLQDSVTEGQHELLTNHISRSASKLRGTRPYWNDARHKLECLVHNMNSPHLFFTFSAADVQWHDLHQHMPAYTGEDFVRDPNRHRIASKSLTENPHIAADYLHRRFSLFFKHVLRTLLPVVDYWYRFEWQQRGSGHIHGFIWLDQSAPSTTNEASRARIVDYWSQWVTAMNPDRTLIQDGLNPASLPFAQQENSRLHLIHSLNRFQRHQVCSPTYCLRKPKGELNATARCRFHFPQPFRDTAAVTRDKNPLHWKYMPQRNDSLLNSYIPALTLGWMANTDMAPCTNPHAVLNYIAKYASKAETKSETYKSMFAAVVRRASSTNPILSATVKMMNALLVERDWPAQEVVHNVLGLPLVVSSRKVVSLDLRREPTTLIEVSNGSLQRRGSSLLEKYLQRATCSVENDDVDLDSLTLLDFARHCEIQPRSNRLFRRPRARPRCVNIFPRYTPDAQGDDYEEFCRVKLMLHHPFLDAGAESLRRASGDSAPTFRFAYEQCLATACHHERDPLDPLDDSENDAISDYEEASEAEDDGIQPAFAELAERHGNCDAALLEPGLDLGTRSLDVAYDWHSNDHIYEQYGSQDGFIRLAKTRGPDNARL